MIPYKTINFSNMKNILIALLIGIIAGAIDALPMIKNKNVPRFSIMAIFTQWVVIGLLIPFVNWEIALWLKGLIIGELGMLPFLIIAFYRSKKSIIPTIIMIPSGPTTGVI